MNDYRDLIDVHISGIQHVGDLLAQGRTEDARDLWISCARAVWQNRWQSGRRYSLRRLGESLELLLGLGARRVTLSVNYRDEWTEKSRAELRQGLRDASDVWMQRFRAGQPLPVDPLHTKILTHLKGGLPCPSRCLLGGREFTVVPSGRIYPCAQMVEEDTREELTIGHVDTGLNAERVAEHDVGRLACDAAQLHQLEGDQAGERASGRLVPVQQLTELPGRVEAVQQLLLAGVEPDVLEAVEGALSQRRVPIGSPAEES